MSRTIGVVTTARSDYGIYVPILRRIQATPGLSLQIYAGGMHLSPEFGLTVREIETDGFPIAERVEFLLSSDSPEGISKSVGLGVVSFAQVFARLRPDILILLGDRFEMFAAAVAALPFKIPLAHIHGGEATEALIDDAIRHALTKMSHLHFASTALYGQRIIQMGEEPWRVTISGAPALDQLGALNWADVPELEGRLGVSLPEQFLLVTYHPVTLEYEHTDAQMRELLGALEAVGLPVIFTFPNADTNSRAIVRQIETFAASYANQVQIVANLGSRLYFSLMRRTTAMVGNSSSGIIEAASFGLPVVNVGNRQRGRLHGANVVDVPCERTAIARAIESAASAEFRAQIQGMANPYGDGQAAGRIVKVLAEVVLDKVLLQKRFYTSPGALA